jgi:Flp pilus assembly protein TadD
MPEFLNQVRLATADFDTALLEIPQFENLDESDQVAAITAYFENELVSSLGSSDIRVTTKEIVVRWSEPQPIGGLAESALKSLNSGDPKTGALLLRLSIAGGDRSLSTRLNLGMVLSDLGELSEAIRILKEVVSEDTDNANAWVAYGIANKRNGNSEKATKALRRALSVEDGNPYALKNLGAVLCENEKTSGEGLEMLERASQIMPGDVQVWLGLGQVYEDLKKLDDADLAYRKVLDLAPFGQFNDMAKEGLSRVSESSFREPGHDRPDAVMYCLGALERFQGMPMDEVKKISMEIAVLGMSGLDVNDPEQKYTLKSLAGNFSGLHLFCIEYVGFKMFEPSLDLGFDISSEYQQAQNLFESQQG